MKNKSVCEAQFWENVAVSLELQRRSFAWLEREAGLARAMIPASRTKKLGLMLTTVLKVAATLRMSPDSLLHGRYVFHQEGGRNG